MELDNTLVILLAGGAGERLLPLTRERARPAVYFGGPYRIIDFTLSNCINSGLRRIFIATRVMPGVRVERHARVRRAIIDRGVLIPRGALIGHDQEQDRRRRTVTDGGVVVVEAGDEPLTGPISKEADRRGTVMEVGSDVRPG